MIKFINNLKKDEKGATMLEYAMLAALISVVAIVAITQLGQSGNRAFQSIGNHMNNATN